MASVMLLVLAACTSEDEDPTAAPDPTATTAPAAATTAPATAVPEEAPDDAMDRDVPRNRTMIMVVGEAGSGGRNPGYETFSMFLGWPTWHTGAMIVQNDPAIMFNVLTGEWENWTIEGWEYNSTFDELTIDLKDHVYWADGKQLDADDWVFMFNYLRDAVGTIDHIAAIHEMEVGGASKIDDFTVKFKLEEPNPIWWNTTVSSNHGVTEQMLREDIWGDKDVTEFSNYDPEKGWPMGTGPFTLTSTTAEQTIWDRRDTWWAAEAGFKRMPEIERVVMLPGREEVEQLRMLARNEIDSSGQLSVAAVNNAIEQSPYVSTFTGRDGALGYMDWCPHVLGFNASEPPFDDKELRYAVNWAIDRTRLIDAAEFGAGVPALHPFVPKGVERGGYSEVGWSDPFLDILDPIVEGLGIDASAHLDRQEGIMTRKGYEKNSSGLWEKDGETIPFYFYVPEFWKQYGPPLAEMLREGGFDARFDTSPGRTEQHSAGEIPYFGCRGPSGVSGMDPWFMMDIYHSRHNRLTGDPSAGWMPDRWSNARFDEIVDEMRFVEADSPRMFELFEEGMTIWMEELPQIYLAQLHVRNPKSHKYWTNWPTTQNPYSVDLPVQQEFLKVIINLTATGAQ